MSTARATDPIRGLPGSYAILIVVVAIAEHTIRTRAFSLLNNTLNRATSLAARSGHGPFSLIRHVGRKSGRTYETPVILAKAPEGFIAELTYGDDVNWYRNIVAAGGCVVIHHRVEYGVNQIELFEAKRGREAFPAPFRTILQATGRSEFRLLRTESSPLLGG
jgi:deazaflavin-dependent oxidoreductase (nitroreductase family)